MGKSERVISMGYAEKFVDMFPVKVKPYLKIMRLHDPTLNVMVFWPTAWSIELSRTTRHWPDGYLLLVFVMESFILHGAGLILNDMFDRSIDVKVKRTQSRPLVTGELTYKQAACLLVFSLSVGIALLLQFKRQCLWLLVACSICSSVYPISKKFIYFPEIVLGVSCSFSVLIGWIASIGELDWRASPLYISGVLYWTVSYTIYNCQDKRTDIKIGVKSATLKFGNQTGTWLWGFSCMFLTTLAISGYMCQQTWPYYLFLLISGAVIAHKLSSVDLDDPASCYEHYSFSVVGLTVLWGIMAGNLIK
ncbi:4-hydroxybenzoate polyprenyltransferase, mitochondrial-like [Mercenaria mercenaria]|uniref:4-hydroxybenzoate polyprenyltransferase, mitochondrial-like n=1 Tax=Mercenaria mercenaria TaxID=6596 RepID=UPI00234E3B4E|nr:4-hydroxybenzoate polyprenyltransferase, mitochondrial-like [Mercenaria mercenaria]XP_053382487.1 4-hydroxybenzoate polyprenyltransferase, mitochondrial-like [Mercenaria mercenaria]